MHTYVHLYTIYSLDPAFTLLTYSNGKTSQCLAIDKFLNIYGQFLEICVYYEIFYFWIVQQTIENEFHVAISAEKSVPSSSDKASTSTKDSKFQIYSFESHSEQPTKPPRQRQKLNKTAETPIYDLENLEKGTEVSWKRCLPMQ